MASKSLGDSDPYSFNDNLKKNLGEGDRFGTTINIHCMHA